MHRIVHGHRRGSRIPEKVHVVDHVVASVYHGLLAACLPEGADVGHLWRHPLGDVVGSAGGALITLFHACRGTCIGRHASVGLEAERRDGEQPHGKEHYLFHGIEKDLVSIRLNA